MRARISSANAGLVLLVFSALLFPGPVWSSLKPDSLNLWLDYACFGIVTDSGQDTLTALDIYYGLNCKELASDSLDSLRIDSLRLISLSLDVRSSSDSLIAEKKWDVAYRPIPRDSAQASQILSDIYRTELPPGEYKLTLTCQDRSTGRIGWQTVLVKVPGFATPALKLSDIQLALKISQTAEQNKFTKNSKLVLPNPTTIYGILDPLLYFYAEAYNLNRNGADTLYSLSYDVLDSNGVRFKEYGQYTKVKPGNSSVISAGLNIASLPSGKYQLQLIITDLGNGQSSQSRKTFFIYREEEFLNRAAEQVIPDPWRAADRSRSPGDSQYHKLHSRTRGTEDL